jgi:hypothetical protein
MNRDKIVFQFFVFYVLAMLASIIFIEVSK